ncbi:MAG TPA: quinone oxidoreductase [Gaiellaceae bacterium]|nr:quinone oxidoreductase [Gaiellaceae bacterium]
MKAIWFEREGGPDVLELRDVPEPEPKDGQVLVDVEAIGVNYRDIYERERKGYGADAPAIIGTEAGGTTADGERLAWAHGTASYAEKVAVDRAKAVTIPDGVATDVAVAVLLQGMTAYYLAHESYPIEAGDRVLVHAAAGGVGLLLTQIAKLRGAYVIGTASTDEKRELARAAGADEVLGYDELDGVGDIAAVYDGVGKDTFDADFEVLRPTGRLILYGAASGEPDPFEVRKLTAGSFYVQRPTLATYTRTPELLQELAGNVFGLVADGKLDVRIGHRYPLAEARQAHEDLVARRTTGKILLVP